MSIDPKLETFLADAPIFLQPWWLEAVAPGQWDYVVVKRGEEIAAAMPYVSRMRFGWRFIEGPSKTPHLGPWLPQMINIPKTEPESRRNGPIAVQFMNDISVD